MIDVIMLGAIRRGSENALGKIIEKYGAYVCVVAYNAVGGRLAREDVEETASDVFFALWENADKVRKMKPWLAATARNKALNKLRKASSDVLFDDEIEAAGDADLEEMFIINSEREAAKEAVLSMDSPDRDIFLRHYFEAETVAVIAAEIGLTEAAVKHRLVRGRKKLKNLLESEVSV